MCSGVYVCIVVQRTLCCKHSSAMLHGSRLVADLAPCGAGRGMRVPLACMCYANASSMVPGEQPLLQLEWSPERLPERVCVSCCCCCYTLHCTSIVLTHCLYFPFVVLAAAGAGQQLAIHAGLSLAGLGPLGEPEAHRQVRVQHAVCLSARSAAAAVSNGVAKQTADLVSPACC